MRRAVTAERVAVKFIGHNLSSCYKKLMPKRKNNLVKMQAAQKLLGWYDRHRRVLPWRALPDETPDPYRVWLSEIMLQQTTVVTVKPYYEKFLTLFPTIHDLAAAPDDAVMTAWAGLGYYSRARNLLKCARTLVAEHDGIFPQEESALLTLPGIGPYTAAAIAAIAFNQQAAPVDGNIERVLARLLALTTPLPKLKAEVKTFAAQLLEPDAPQNRPPHTRLSDNRPGDIAQAMMDLGATICTPKRPNCLLCPWQEDCAAKRQGIEETLPRRAPKKPKPERQGTVWWLENEKGEVLMHRRPEKGLLGGMMMLPSAGWDADNDSTLRDILPHDWTPLAGSVVHVFTHFRLTLKVERLTLTPLTGAPPRFEPPAAHIWVHPKDFHDTALPSVMRKVVTHVLG